MTAAFSIVVAIAVAAGLALLTDELRWQIRRLAMAIARLAASKLADERSRAENATNWAGYVAYICDEERRHLKALLEALGLLTVGLRRMRLDQASAVKRVINNWGRRRELERAVVVESARYFLNRHAHRRRGEYFPDFYARVWREIYEQEEENLEE